MTDLHGEFTVKEMLTQIVLPKLEAIDEKLDRVVDRSEFGGLVDRVSTLELHGSSQAVTALKDLHELEKLVADIRHEQNSRAHYTKIVDGNVQRIDDLVNWRNRMIGGLLVVASAASFSLLRIWLGV